MTRAGSRPSWSAHDLRQPAAAFALGASLLACFVLLGLVRYCPGYGVGRGTMLQLYFGTFWGEIFPSRAAAGSLAGETTASQWTYCALVPPIFAGLIWWKWPELRARPVQGHVSGYGILAAGALLYLAGYLMENYYVGIGSMEIIYAGIIVLFLGWPMLRQLFFPVAFLMFMWPYDFMEDVALKLRLVMSGISHTVLQVIGVPNILNGTAILSAPGSPHAFAIDIADPCSGIRSLFALVMIAAVLAYTMFRGLGPQVVIVLLAVPMVVLGNLVRIVILALATIHLGDQFAIGTNDQPSWFHEGAGYLVYAVNFGGLILIALVLERFWPDRPTAPRPERSKA